MKIRFSIISPDIFSQVRSTVDLLTHAVESGNMDVVDITTDKLLALTAGCHSIELSEKEWRVFLDGIRSKNPEFRSNYLLPGDICAPLFPAIADDHYVLELPIDGDMEEEKVDV